MKSYFVCSSIIMLHLTFSGIILDPVHMPLARAANSPEKGYYLAAAAPDVQYDSDDETEKVTIYISGCDDTQYEGTTGTVRGREELSGIWTGHEPSRSGQWSVSFTLNGKFEIKGPDKEWYSGKYACDNTQTPKYLNLHVKESSDPAYIRKLCLVIYKIDRNTLTFAASGPGVKIKPSSFTPGNDTRVLVVTKQK